MTKRLINTGVASSLLLILIQLTIGFFELIKSDNKTIGLTLNILNSLSNITMFIVIWKVLVKFYNQSQLDLIIKSMIVVFTITNIISLVISFQVFKTGMILIIVLSFINLILYIVFIGKILDIEKFEIKQIEYLKNYSSAFIICFFVQFILTILIELKNKDTKYINHFLLAIPTIFIVIFFTKIKNEIKLYNQNLK